MKKTQVIIVRHGQTQWNLKLIRQGHLDSPLTEKGMAQAKALAQRLAQEKFNALYSSDLGRAVQTAEMIAAVTGHEIVTDARLRERNLGVFQGLNGDEIKEKFPEEYRFHRSLEFMNASLNVFNYEDGNWFLQTWGDVSHLGVVGTADGDDP